MSDGPKQRAHGRIDVSEEYEPIGALVRQYATNISKGGAFIRTKQLIPIGTEVNLKIPVITDDDDDEEADDLYFIEGVGRVVRVESSPGNEGFGVVFLSLTPESQALVDTLTANKEGDSED